MLITWCFLITASLAADGSLFHVAQAPLDAPPVETTPSAPDVQPAPPAVAPEPALPPVTPAPIWGEVRLPDRISPAELNRLVLDLPGTFEVVDIRPAEQFNDYSIPGARNAVIAEVVNNPMFLQGSTPLILVDRDGSIAMAVGGIVAQRTRRPVKVLHGGLEAYWEEVAVRGGTAQTPAARDVERDPGAPPPPPREKDAAPEGAAPQAPKPPQKRIAGC